MDLSGLDSNSPSSEIIEALLTIRSKSLKNPRGIKYLIKTNVVSKLVSFLERPNSKIVDISLSILGNLMLEEIPRNQIRHCKGIPTVLGIISSLGEENIISRACRTIANVAQHPKNVKIMFDGGVLPLLIKTLSEVNSPRTKQVIVRALRILGTDQHYKKKIVQGQGVLCVSRLLDIHDKELLRAVTRCLAHFTHGGDLDVATHVQGETGSGFRKLVELARHRDPRISESSLAALINLSHVDSVRPNLGNAGTVAVLVERLETCDKSNEISHGVTALCLFCRESVNRMKLRDSGGLALFVNLLQNKNRSELHDRIINSLLQFHYDNSSLNELQKCGLIPVLLKFIDEETEGQGEHTCEAEICNVDENVEKEEPKNEDEHDDEESKKVIGTTEEGDEEETQESDNDVGATVEDQELEVKTFMRKKTKADVKFRVDSPSYQEVQMEFEQFLKVRDNVMDFEDTTSLCMSPDRSPWSSPSWRDGYSPTGTTYSGYSPTGTVSPGNSPNNSIAESPPTTPPRYSSFSPLSHHGDESSLSPPSSPAEMISVSADSIYSPIERYSEEEPEQDNDNVEEEEEEEEEEGQQQQQMNADPVPSTSREYPPAPKRLRKSKSWSKFNRVHSIYETSTSSCSTPSTFSTPTRTFMETSTDSRKGSSIQKKENKSSRINWILQILSRLSQAEKPHENMTALQTTQTLVRYLCGISDPGESRAARIILRLSRNLYAFMSLIYQRHLSWLKIKLDRFCTLADSPCHRCQKLFSFQNSFQQNISLLAETGYAEGEMCHNLLRGTLDERRSIAISTPFVARPRKLLRNLLLNHEGLDIIRDVMENNHEDDCYLVHAVLSINILCSHLGVINPNLTMSKTTKTTKCKNLPKCHFRRDLTDNDPNKIVFVLDDNSKVVADRSILATGGSEVFSAMFEGSFVESERKSITLPFTSQSGLECLLHRIYGCDWNLCPIFKTLSVSTLLELVTLSDKYLLEDFNTTVSLEIIRRCLVGGSDVVEIYKKSLLVHYPIHGLCDDSLAKCTVQYLMVGAMPTRKRVQLFLTLLKSEMKTDFLDDMTQIITQKLNEFC